MRLELLCLNKIEKGDKSQVTERQQNKITRVDLFPKLDKWSRNDCLCM